LVQATTLSTTTTPTTTTTIKASSEIELMRKLRVVKPK
jgi:hypothetical protein